MRSVYFGENIRPFSLHAIFKKKDGVHFLVGFFFHYKKIEVAINIKPHFKNSALAFFKFRFLFFTGNRANGIKTNSSNYTVKFVV